MYSRETSAKGVCARAAVPQWLRRLGWPRPHGFNLKLNGTVTFTLRPLPTPTQLSSLTMATAASTNTGSDASRTVTSSISFAGVSVKRTLTYPSDIPRSRARVGNLAPPTFPKFEQVPPTRAGCDALGSKRRGGAPDSCGFCRNSGVSPNGAGDRPAIKRPASRTEMRRSKLGLWDGRAVPS